MAKSSIQAKTKPILLPRISELSPPDYELPLPYVKNYICKQLNIDDCGKTLLINPTCLPNGAIINYTITLLGTPPPLIMLFDLYRQTLHLYKPNLNRNYPVISYHAPFTKYRNLYDSIIYALSLLGLPTNISRTQPLKLSHASTPVKKFTRKIIAIRPGPTELIPSNPKKSCPRFSNYILEAKQAYKEGCTWNLATKVEG